MTKPIKPLEVHTDETEACFKQLTKTLAPFSPVVQHSATTCFVVTMTLRVKSKDETAAWLETLAQGVRDGNIALSSPPSVN